MRINILNKKEVVFLFLIVFILNINFIYCCDLGDDCNDDPVVVNNQKSKSYKVQEIINENNEIDYSKVKTGDIIEIPPDFELKTKDGSKITVPKGTKVTIGKDISSGQPIMEIEGNFNLKDPNADSTVVENGYVKYHEGGRYQITSARSFLKDPKREDKQDSYDPNINNNKGDKVDGTSGDNNPVTKNSVNGGNKIKPTDFEKPGTESYSNGKNGELLKDGTMIWGSIETATTDNTHLTNGVNYIKTDNTLSFDSANTVALKYDSNETIDGTEFQFRNLGKSVVNLDNGTFKFALVSGGDNGTSSVQFPGVQVNFTGELTIEVNGNEVEIIGENMSASTGEETVIGDASIILIIDGEMQHIGIGQYSRYEFLGYTAEEKDTCRKPMSFYNPIDEWHQIFMIKEGIEVKHFSDSCDFCSYLNFINNSYLAYNPIRIERKSIISTGWDNVIDSNCYDNIVYLEMDECFDNGKLDFKYDGLNEYREKNNYENTKCLSVDSYVFNIEQIGVDEYVNHESYPKENFIVSYKTPYGSLITIDNKSLDNEILSLNAPYNKKISVVDDNFWTRIMDKFDDLLKQVS